jgi:hypothetical protein
MMRKFLLGVITSVMLVISPVSFSDDISLVCCTYHPNHDLNDINPGLLYRHFVNDDTFVIGGGYYNSFEKTSLLVGAGREFDVNKHLSFSVSAGYITGYEKTNIFFMPSFIIKDRAAISLMPNAVNLSVKLFEF